MTYTCYAHMKDEVSKRLDRIVKKATRYGSPFSYTVGDEHPHRVNVYAVDPADGHTQYIKTWYNVAAIDFDIDCEQLVRQNGWTVIAKLEHGDKGNIVTGFNCEVDPAWYSAPARCEHCNTNRSRSITFMCRKDGEIRQVGRTCLKDYTGIAPEAALLFAEVSDIFPGDDWDMTESEFAGSGVARMYEVVNVIALAVDSIKKNGYHKSDSRNPTRDQVLENINKEPSAEAKAKAEIIAAWLIERGEKALVDDKVLAKLDREAFEYDSDDYSWVGVRDESKRMEYIKFRDAWDRVTDLERNCAVLAASGFAKANHVGRLVYTPVAYDKYLERKAREEQREIARAAAAEHSRHVGQIGERITVSAASGEFVTSWETQYGTTFLYKLSDADGNVFVWFASRPAEIKAGATVKGTVKDHTERDGIKQTVLTRCKVS